MNRFLLPLLLWLFKIFPEKLLSTSHKFLCLQCHYCISRRTQWFLNLDSIWFISGCYFFPKVSISSVLFEYMFHLAPSQQAFFLILFFLQLISRIWGLINNPTVQHLSSFVIYYPRYFCCSVLNSLFRFACNLIPTECQYNKEFSLFAWNRRHHFELLYIRFMCFHGISPLFKRFAFEIVSLTKIAAEMTQ